MAGKRKRDSWVSMLSCVVCHEDNEEEGDHVPRLLPCTHTLCESCIKQTMGNKTLVCPACRKKHKIQNKEKSFSRNEYLLVHIQQNSYKRCQNHDMELTLFCYEDICCKPICISCLIDHNKHDIKRIETREIDHFRKELTAIKTNLEAKVKLISEARKHVADRTSKFVATLRKVKKQIDKTIKEAENNQTVE